MDRDNFIITVYCLVCERYQDLQKTYRLRRGGFTPALTDEEVMTIEICGEFFKCSTDPDIFDYFFAHYQDFFPCLGDRTLFVRQAANLWRIKAIIQRRLTLIRGQANDPVPVIDTLPLPVCGFTRARRERCWKPEADYGYCAAKKLHDYGFTLGQGIARSGMIIDSPLLPARPHDVHFLEELVEGFSGTVPADSCFIDAFRHALWEARYGAKVITPPRKGMTTSHRPHLLRACRRLRKRIETVGSQLTERFGMTRLRVLSLWHYQHRLIRKVLAHTVGVFLNLQLGNAPLDLDGWLAH